MPRAYFAFDDSESAYVQELPSLLDSLQKLGVDFKAHPACADWLQSEGVSAPLWSVPNVLQQLSELHDPNERFLLFILPGRGLEPQEVALMESLVAYSVSLQDPRVLVITDPRQYRLLQPNVLQNETAYIRLARQLLQDIQPFTLLPLRHTVSRGDRGRPLYAANPAWAEAIGIHQTRIEHTLTDADYRSVMMGSQLMLQLARTDGVFPAQALLLQHGHPVQFACRETGIADAVRQVLFQTGPLTPGGTLVVSHALPVASIKAVAAAGIRIIAATQWEGEGLAALTDEAIPVSIHLETLQIAASSLQSVNGNSLLWLSPLLDAREMQWDNVHRPSESQALDLELATALLELLPPASAVLLRDQKSLGIADGLAHPAEAVSYVLSQSCGESREALCVLSGAQLTPDVLHQLTQANVAGLLWLSAPDEPLPALPGAGELPFFVARFAAPERMAIPSGGARYA